MSSLNIRSSSTTLPSIDIESIVNSFSPALKQIDAKVKELTAKVKADPTNQEKQFQLTQAVNKQSALWQTLSAIADKMFKTLEAIIASMRG